MVSKKELEKYGWAALFSVIMGCLFLYFENAASFALTNLFNDRSVEKWFLHALGFIIFLILIIFIFSPFKQLKRQKIHEQPSWVFYTYIALLFAPLTSYLLSSLSILPYQIFYLPVRPLVLSPIVDLYWRICFLVTGWLIYLQVKPLELLDFRNFAAGAVGIEKDNLDYAPSALNVSKGLLSIKTQVSVVVINGGMGFGKSSYAKMVIQQLPKEKVFYTYISLTETNEAKDFSKLFSERWFETLSERYPKIDHVNKTNLMKAILRENGQDILSSFFDILSEINKGLIKTFQIKTNRSQGEYVVDSTAKLFGNINEIKEEAWVIMIDEIERAQLTEIYRVIEVMERFKTESVAGLPVKIVFLLCVSRSDLEAFLNTFEKQDTLAFLIKRFFLNDPKSITQNIFLPPIPPGRKLEYILNNFSVFSQYKTIKELMEKGIPNDNVGVERGIPSEEDIINYVIYLLLDESPRIISRTSQELEFFLASFKNKKSELKSDIFRFGDLILISYIRVKYPYLIEFFANTVYRINSSLYALKDYDLRNKKTSLLDWISKVTGYEFSQSEDLKEFITKLTHTINYRYLGYIGVSTLAKEKYQEGALSNPHLLQEYLYLVSDELESPDKVSIRIYSEHKQSIGHNYLKDLTNGEIINYSRYLSLVEKVPFEMYQEVVEELHNRMVTGLVELNPVDIGETEFDDFIYQFISQVLNVFDQGPKDHGIWCIRLIEDFLYTESISLGIKYILLNAFYNHSRTSSELGYRLNQVSKIMTDFDAKGLKNAIRYVYKEFQNKYVNGATSIYKAEENFIYTLYQSWSGNIEDTKSIETVREIALNDLKNHPEAIKVYWDQFPYKESYETIEDVINDNLFFSENTTELYMPLKNLLKISKEAESYFPDLKSKIAFWNRVYFDAEQKVKYNDARKIKNDNSTLTAVMIFQGFWHIKNGHKLSFRRSDIQK